MATLHYASGDNFDSQGNFTPAQAGFNLADVGSVGQLNSLPDGVKGLVWLDKTDGVTQDFIDAVTPYIGNPKAFAFFLADEPDPTGQWGKQVSAENLKAESDWIHEHLPGAKTFITMMNLGSHQNPGYSNTYNPQNSHIDLYGIDPYPVRSETSTPNYDMIDRTVAAVEASGVPHDQIVPVFQTFGGGDYADGNGGKYVMPTAAEEQQLLDHWAALLPNPAFDYAYAWGSQRGDQALESSSELQNVLLHHNTSGSSAALATDPPPASTSSSSTLSAAAPAGNESTDAAASSTPPAENSSTAGGSSGATDPGADPSSAAPSSPVVTTPPTERGHHGLGFFHLTNNDPSFTAARHHFASMFSATNDQADTGAKVSSGHDWAAFVSSHLGFAAAHGFEHTHHWSWHM